MHRALQIVEIVCEVAQFIAAEAPAYNYRGDARRRADLAAMARACKTFYEPTMDSLWGFLDSLSPLAQLVPTIQSASTEDQVSTTYSLFFFLVFLDDTSNGMLVSLPPPTQKCCSRQISLFSW